MILIIRFPLCWYVFAVYTLRFEKLQSEVSCFSRKKTSGHLKNYLSSVWCYIRSRYLFYLALCRIKRTTAKKHNRSLLGWSSLGSAKIIKEFISTTWKPIVKQITILERCISHVMGIVSRKMINCSWIINFKQLFVLKAEWSFDEHERQL